MQTSSSSSGSNFGPKWISAKGNEIKTQYPLPPFNPFKLEEGGKNSLSIPIVIPGEGKDTSIENLFVQQNWSNMALKGLVQFTISSNHIAKKEHIESIQVTANDLVESANYLKETVDQKLDKIKMVIEHTTDSHIGESRILSEHIEIIESTNQKIEKITKNIKQENIGTSKMKISKFPLVQKFPSHFLKEIMEIEKKPETHKVKSDKEITIIGGVWKFFMIK